MPSPQPTPSDPLTAILVRLRALPHDAPHTPSPGQDPYQRFPTVAPEMVARALAEHHRVELVPPRWQPSRELIQQLSMISSERARAARIIPYGRDAHGVILATDRPDLFPQLTQDLEFLLGNNPLRCVVAPPNVIDRLLDDHLPLPVELGLSHQRGKTGASQDAPIVQLVDRILLSALERRASDILIQPEANLLRVRFRIDGVLRDVQAINRIAAEQIAARLTNMAELKPDESRRPQDGRFQQVAAGRAVDFRISFFRVADGETIAIRILDSTQGLLSLGEIGLLSNDKERLERLIHEPNGLLLVSGPTGSGKTTTLYAALNARNTRDVSIYTIEDPVEYRIPGIMQSSVHEAIGVTFQSGLRTLLRHNPNIILVGEIRDSETASIAAQAAMTGHLVFSTIHTNDAVGAITRMVDLGTERFVVGSSIRAVVAQRLVRELCDHCAQPGALSQAEAQLLGVQATAADAPNIRHPVGCPECEQTGYRGRLPVFEILEVTEPIRDLLYDGARESAIRDLALQSGALSPLRSDAILKVTSGRTSVAEVVRVLGRPRPG